MTYLTGPVNTLQDFEVEFNGLLMGGATNYGVPPVWQFLDLAPTKTMDVARVWADGSDSGPDFADVYTPAMDVEISASTAAGFAAAVSAFLQVFVTNAVAVPLWVKIPGMPVQGIAAKTNKRVMPIDVTWGQLCIASVQWRMTDPIWQSIPRTLTLVSSGSVKSGLVFPMFSYATATYSAPPGAADFGLTTAGGSAGVLTNAGNTEAWPVVTVTAGGSAIVGGFQLVLDGHTVAYGLDVPAGQSVTVDYSTGTASLGGSDRTLALTSRDFTSVAPQGTSNMTFTAASGSALVTVADRWR